MSVQAVEPLGDTDLLVVVDIAVARQPLAAPPQQVVGAHEQAERLPLFSLQDFILIFVQHYKAPRGDLLLFGSRPLRVSDGSKKGSPKFGIKKMQSC